MTTKLLANQLKGILADPVEGFTVELGEAGSLLHWTVYIEGPRDTCYEGGVFQLSLDFPKDYPMSPPVLKFISDFWHPNVYHDGKVCMSILHPPGEDAMSGELARERWLPTQSVTTIVLSLLSLLNDPNCSSPANVDASVEWRKNKEGYIKKCKELVLKANREKPPHVSIPHPDTNEDEHRKIVQKWKEMNKDLDYEDFYEPPEEDEDEEEEEEDEDSESEEGEDEDELLESNGEMKEEDEDDEEEAGEKNNSVKGKAKEPEITPAPSGSSTSDPSTTTSSSPRHSTNLKLVVDESGSSSTQTTSSRNRDAIAEEISVSNVDSGPSNSSGPRGENSSNSNISNAANSGNDNGKGKRRKSGNKTNKKKCIIM